MYPASLAHALGERGIEAVTVAQLGLGGRPDADVLEAAASEDLMLLTENVADFAALSADWLLEGRHHPGILIALSSRFSHRASGRSALADAVSAVRDDHLNDRVIYLSASR